VETRSGDILRQLTAPGLSSAAACDMRVKLVTRLRDWFYNF